MSFISRRSAFNRAGNCVEALTDEQIMRLAPSAFASEKHESRSDRYAYIPTSEVIDGLRANGSSPCSPSRAGAGFRARLTSPSI